MILFPVGCSLFAKFMKTILFVEDEPTLQKLVGRFLEKEGYLQGK